MSFNTLKFLNFRIGVHMFSLHKSGNNKKVISLSSDQRKQEVKKLVKALQVKILSTYVGNEDESTTLIKEQAEDKNRDKKVQELKNQIKKISKSEKSKTLDLKNRILQKEKIIELINDEINYLVSRKNKAIKSYVVEQALNDQPSPSDDNKSEELKALYLKEQQIYLQKIYIEQEKSQLGQKFKNIKMIMGQETVVDQIQKRLTDIIASSDNNNYYTVIQHLQQLIAELKDTKSLDTQVFKELAAVKLAKKLATQTALLQKYQEYMEKNKENEPQHNTAPLSPAHKRAKLIIETNHLRGQLHEKILKSIEQKYSTSLDKNLNYLRVAAQYCIAELEQVDPTVLEVLQKKCIDAGWVLDKQKGLIYRSHQNTVLQISKIHELSYNAYIEIGARQLSGKPEINAENTALVLAKPTDLKSPKGILCAFEQDLKKSKEKIVPYKKQSSLWLYCLDKALVAVKPQALSLMALQASLSPKCLVN